MMRKPEDEIHDGPLADAHYVIDFDLALIVARSAITRIVVARIAEQAGLKTHSQAPEDASAIIGGSVPAIALLAGGADGHDCDELLGQLVAIQRGTGSSRAPRLIMLTNVVAHQPHHAMIDATIVMPATPDQLQPIIRDLIDSLRG